MITLKVSDVLKDRVLVSRESARSLEAELQAILAQPDSAGSGDRSTVRVDFSGVEGIAPSFLDELLTILQSLAAGNTGEPTRRIMITNPPMRLSLKFEAIARSHGMSVEASPDGSWLLTAA